MIQYNIADYKWYDKCNINDIAQYDTEGCGMIEYNIPYNIIKYNIIHNICNGTNDMMYNN